MDALTYLAVAVAVGAGAWLGWRFRGMRHLTERRVLEEIYSRKTKLAESEREIAVRTLDSAKLEASTNQERFEAAAADVAKLEHELGGTRKALAATRETLANTETRLDSTMEGQAARLAQAETAAEEAARAIEARRKMANELDETRNLPSAELAAPRTG